MSLPTLLRRCSVVVTTHNKKLLLSTTTASVSGPSTIMIPTTVIGGGCATSQQQQQQYHHKHTLVTPSSPPHHHHHHPARRPGAFQRRYINSSALTIQLNTQTSRKMPPKEELTFGTTLSNHMLLVEWHKGSGWDDPKIVPYGNLEISPAASSLHYGLQCFEGMKAYRTLSNPNELRLFRPDCNMERLSDSMQRLQMPCYDFDQDAFLDCMKELIKLDEDWVPEGEGYSLYIRPTAIATHPYLGLAAPESILMYCITGPVGPYFKSGFNPVKLLAEESYVRAWPGGTGDKKVGGNYGPTMKPAAEAAARGYDQVLWLFGDNKEVTEVGGMNVFFFLINAETKRHELVTPPLTRGDILPGVTRRSILELARTWDEFDVSERYPTMDEIRDAAHDGRLLEAFGAGTAAVVAPVKSIHFEGEELEPLESTGTITKRVWDEITGIQYGKIDGPEGWSVVI